MLFIVYFHLVDIIVSRSAKIARALSTFEEKQDVIKHTLQSCVRNCQSPETPTKRFRRMAENFSRVGSLYLLVRHLSIIRFNVLNIRYRVAVQIKRCQLPAPIIEPPSAERASSRGRENHL